MREPRAYYNEHDPFAAAWLRALIAAGEIAAGDVDERSVTDVTPNDLAGYAQCHFFAGIGVWSAALRGAGWADARPVWTGSCPCQPFSTAGRRAGTDDERHLWPVWFALIRECRPPVVFGEQVASPLGLAWLDAVHADLEGAGYAIGAADLCAAGLGAPHIRQRLYFVADPHGERRSPWGLHGPGEADQGRARGAVAGHGLPHGLADSARRGASAAQQSGRLLGAQQSGAGVARGVGHPTSNGRGQGVENGERGVPRVGEAAGGGHGRSGPHDGIPAGVAQGDASSPGLEGRDAGSVGGECSAAQRAGAVGGFWADADWLPCRDGKARPVEPSTFPLVDGTFARVGRLRGYGNAIVRPVAEAFIGAYLDTLGEGVADA